MKVQFDKIGFHSKKSGKCPGCGKRATRSKEFYQTHNPWNKDSEGNIKTPQDIMEELKVRCKEWEEEPTYHARCE